MIPGVEKIEISKAEILEKLPLDENIVTCSVLESNWTMDTLSEPMKTSEIYLNRPKWPRVTSRKSFKNCHFRSFKSPRVDFRSSRFTSGLERSKVSRPRSEIFIQLQWD